jgi:hypothetical protein
MKMVGVGLGIIEYQVYENVLMIYLHMLKLILVILNSQVQ